MSKHKKNDLIQLILEKKRQIILFVSLWMIIGFLYSLYSTPLYKSYISLYPSDNNTSVSAMGDFGSMVSQFQNLTGGSNNLGGLKYHIKDLVESRQLKDKIINKKWSTTKSKDPITLIEYWELNENNYDGMIDWVKVNIFGMLRDDLDRNRLEDAYNILSNRIEIIEEDSGLFTINVLMEEAELSADIANYIKEEIHGYISEKSSEKAKENLDFINIQKESAFLQLTFHEEELKAFEKLNPAADMDIDAKFEKIRKARDLEISQELYLTILKEYKLSEIEAQKEKDTVYGLDEAVPAVDRSEPSLLIILIVMFNFSLISIVSFFFIRENYFKK